MENKKSFWTKNKKSILAILFIIIARFLINISYVIYNDINSKKAEKINNEKEIQYNIDVNRFDILIPKGEYKAIKSKNFSYDYDQNFEKEFKAQSELLTFNKDINTKYSDYIITKDSTYLKLNINNEQYILKYPVPLSDNQLTNLRNWVSKDEGLSILPFNDGIYCLVQTSNYSYIINTETGEVTANLGNGYESFKINIYTDKLECIDNMTSNTLIYDKNGELEEEIEASPPVTILELVPLTLVIASTIAIPILINSIILRSIKNKIIKVLSTILITIFTIFILFIYILILFGALVLLK